MPDNVEISIEKIVVLCLGHGTDKVLIHTTFPAPVHKELGGGTPLVLSFDVTYKQGIQYVRDNFGIEPEVIGCSEGKGRGANHGS